MFYYGAGNSEDTVTSYYIHSSEINTAQSLFYPWL